LAHKLFFCVIWLKLQKSAQRIITKKTKTLTIMAEVMETQKHYASNAKGNAALTTGRL
jgi:hypothetical protein